MSVTGSTSVNQYSPLSLESVLKIMKKWWLYKALVGLEAESDKPRSEDDYQLFRELISEGVNPLTKEELTGGYKKWNTK